MIIARKDSRGGIYDNVERPDMACDVRPFCEERHDAQIVRPGRDGDAAVEGALRHLSERRTGQRERGKRMDVEVASDDEKELDGEVLESHGEAVAIMDGVFYKGRGS